MALLQALVTERLGNEPELEEVEPYVGELCKNMIRLGSPR